LQHVFRQRICVFSKGVMPSPYKGFTLLCLEFDLSSTPIPFVLLQLLVENFFFGNDDLLGRVFDFFIA